MNPIAQQKVDGLNSALKMQPDNELLKARQRYLQLITQHKNSPDESLLGNYKWHLNMINCELGRRHPKKKSAPQQRPVASSASKQKEQSIDDLKKYLNNTNEAIASHKLTESEMHVKQQTAKAIEKEISSRSEKTDVIAEKFAVVGETATEKKGLSPKMNIVVGVVAFGGLGTLLAWKFGKNKLWFGAGGGVLGLGIALYYNNKKSKTATTLTPVKK